MPVLSVEGINTPLSSVLTLPSNIGNTKTQLPLESMETIASLFGWLFLKPIY